MQRASSVPPGPRGPFILRARRALRDPTGFLIRLTQRYGDVVRLRIGRHVAYLVNDPALIHFVLVERADAFTKTSLTRATERLIGEALFSSEGQAHDRNKRAIQPLFRHERLERLVETAVAVTEEAAAGFRAGEVLDAHLAMADLSLRVALASVLSVRREDEVAHIAEALAGALKAYQRTLNPAGALLDRLPLPSTQLIEASSQELERVVDKAVAARKANPGTFGDVLDLLVQLRFEDGGEPAMTDLELRHEALDLIIGSNETLALALTWSLHELARSEKGQEQIAAQVRDVLGDRAPRLEDTPRLTAARAAFNEALRLHPPAWAFLRRAKAEVQVGGYRLPAGGLILLSPYVTQHDPRFFPDPFVFDLARWEGAARASRPKLSYFPFGAGPRSCLGEPLATAEGTLILATILRRFALEPAGEKPVKEWALGLNPPGAVPVRIRARRASAK